MPEITTLGSAAPGTVVSSGSLITPAGDQGPVGSTGPTAVSANANNKATLGSDSLLLVQGTAAGVAATTHAQTVSGDDPQLTNARTPTAHQATHLPAGTDAIAYPAWTAYTATISPGGGTITTQTSTSAYLQIGKLVFVRIFAQVTNIGTASSTMFVNLPVASKQAGSIAFREAAINGSTYVIILPTGSTAAQVLKYDNSSPVWTNNFAIALTGSYEAN